MSILASAYGTTVAQDLRRYAFWTRKDDRADRALATSLAGLPESTFASKLPATATTTFPLTRAGGFLAINADDVRVKTREREATFKLVPFEAQTQSGAPRQTTSEVSEVDARTILLLRTSSSSLIRDTRSSAYQLYALSVDGTMIRPVRFGLSSREDRTRSREGQSELRRYFQQIAKDGLTQLVLSAGMVAASTSMPNEQIDKGRFRLQTFSFAATSASDPLQPAFKLPEIDSTRTPQCEAVCRGPILFGDYLVVTGNRSR